MASLHRWVYRWRKRLILGVAALPVLQTTGGCDPFVLNQVIVQSLLSTGVQVVAGSVQQVLLQNFPSSDIIQTLLGGNRQPFFQG